MIAIPAAHDQDQIFSFANLSLPVTACQAYVEAPLAWPDGNYIPALDVLGNTAEGLGRPAVMLKVTFFLLMH